VNPKSLISSSLKSITFSAEPEPVWNEGGGIDGETANDLELLSDLAVDVYNRWGHGLHIGRLVGSIGFVAVAALLLMAQLGLGRANCKYESELFESSNDRLFPVPSSFWETIEIWQLLVGIEGIDDICRVKDMSMAICISIWPFNVLAQINSSMQKKSMILSIKFCSMPWWGKVVLHAYL